MSREAKKNRDIIQKLVADNDPEKPRSSPLITIKPGLWKQLNTMLSNEDSSFFTDEKLGMFLGQVKVARSNKAFVEQLEAELKASPVEQTREPSPRLASTEQSSSTSSKRASSPNSPPLLEQEAPLPQQLNGTRRISPLSTRVADAEPEVHIDEEDLSRKLISLSTLKDYDRYKCIVIATIIKYTRNESSRSLLDSDVQDACKKLLDLPSEKVKELQDSIFNSPSTPFKPEQLANVKKLISKVIEKDQTFKKLIENSSEYGETSVKKMEELSLDYDNQNSKKLFEGMDRYKYLVKNSLYSQILDSDVMKLVQDEPAEPFPSSLFKDKGLIEIIKFEIEKGDVTEEIATTSNRRREEDLSQQPVLMDFDINPDTRAQSTSNHRSEHNFGSRASFLDDPRMGTTSIAKMEMISFEHKAEKARLMAAREAHSPLVSPQQSLSPSSSPAPSTISDASSIHDAGSPAPAPETPPLSVRSEIPLTPSPQLVSGKPPLAPRAVKTQDMARYGAAQALQAARAAVSAETPKPSQTPARPQGKLPPIQR